MATKILTFLIVAILCLASQSYAQDVGDQYEVKSFCFDEEPLLKLMAASRIGHDVVFAYDRYLVLSGSCFRAARTARLVERLAPSEPPFNAELWEVDIEGRSFYTLIGVREDPRT